MLASFASQTCVPMELSLRSKIPGSCTCTPSVADDRNRCFAIGLPSRYILELPRSSVREQPLLLLELVLVDLTLGKAFFQDFQCTLPVSCEWERANSPALEPSDYRCHNDDYDNKPDDHHDWAEDHSVPGHHSPRFHSVSSKSSTLDSGSGGTLHGQTRRFPFRISFFKSGGLETALAQLGDRLVREHAIGSAAVSDDRPVARQF